jgi:hypothetical protein
MRRSRGHSPQEGSPGHGGPSHHPRWNRLAHRFAVVLATPVLCVSAVVAALIDMRATAALTLGAAVLIEAVLTYLHRVRPHRRPARSDRTTPDPSGPQHTAVSPTHRTDPARPIHPAPSGRPARTATPTSP